MLLTHQHPHNKQIMVSIIGRPNAGKSSLINHWLGFDLSIVSSKPQTTRNFFHCSLTKDKVEVTFVDSPGVHSSGKELNLRMNGQAQMSCEGADLNLILWDLSQGIDVNDFKKFIKDLEKDIGKTWVVFTKKDLLNKELPLEFTFEKFQEVLPSLERYFVISSKDEEGTEDLLDNIVAEAQPGAHLYPDGSVSNKNMRFFASEYIREQAFHILKEELPYELAVVIDEFNETRLGEDAKVEAKISATIIVNRPSQRAIVVGRKGSVIKEIGTKSREKIEAMMGARVFLNLHVKVLPRWYKNNFVLEEIGLPRVTKSARVWRAQ